MNHRRKFCDVKLRTEKLDSQIEPLKSSERMKLFRQRQKFNRDDVSENRNEWVWCHSEKIFRLQRNLVSLVFFSLHVLQPIIWSFCGNQSCQSGVSLLGGHTPYHLKAGPGESNVWRRKCLSRHLICQFTTWKTCFIERKYHKQDENQSTDQEQLFWAIEWLSKVVYFSIKVYRKTLKCALHCEKYGKRPKITYFLDCCTEKSFLNEI